MELKGLNWLCKCMKPPEAPNLIFQWIFVLNSIKHASIVNLAMKFSAVNLSYSWVAIYLELLGILFSTSLNFAFKTVEVTNPLASGIFLSTLQIFSLDFIYLCCTDSCKLY